MKSWIRRCEGLLIHNTRSLISFCPPFLLIGQVNSKGLDVATLIASKDSPIRVSNEFKAKVSNRATSTAGPNRVLAHTAVCTRLRQSWTDGRALF